jgi:hypothetical protein
MSDSASVQQATVSKTDAWSLLLNWLKTPDVQDTEFARPPLPPHAINQHITEGMTSECRVNFLLGRRAGLNPSADLEPRIRAQDPAEKKECLWEYFFHGFDWAVRNKQPDEAAPQAPATTNRVPKVADPEFFSGDREKFDGFLAQLSLKFATDPTTYRTEQSKVAYAGSFLRGRAEEWFRPHVNT